MSGWDDRDKVELEIEFDLQQASEWMKDLGDDLTQEERAEAMKSVLGILAKKWKAGDVEITRADPEDQKKPEIREHPNDIRPSEVRMTELEPKTGKVQFYSGFKILTDKWLGSRNLDDWPEIFEHMKKNMHPSHDDVNTPQIKWVPKEN